MSFRKARPPTHYPFAFRSGPNKLLEDSIISPLCICVCIWLDVTEWAGSEWVNRIGLAHHGPIRLVLDTAGVLRGLQIGHHKGHDATVWLLLMPVQLISEQEGCFFCVSLSVCQTPQSFKELLSNLCSLLKSFSSLIKFSSPN